MDTQSRGMNALHRRALQLKKWAENEALLEQKEREMGIDPKRPRKSSRSIKFSNQTLFLAACANNDYEEVTRLLDGNLVDIDISNVDGLTALHQAVIDDNEDMVKFLIKKGADLNRCDNEGWTPLHAAASCGHLNLCQVLLDAGADPTIVNNDGELAIDLADNEHIEDLLKAHLSGYQIDQLRNQELLKMLEDVDEWIRSGQFKDVPHPRTGATILHVAAAKGYLDVLQKLLMSKSLRGQIDVNIRDFEGWTPLHAAAYWQQACAVEVLLENGADFNQKTNQGQFAIDLTDNELIQKLIEDRKAKYEAEQLKRKQQELEDEERSQSLSSTVSSPAAGSESETQRRAHAKRVRETRRSTQGISADDVNKAKDILMHQQDLIRPPPSASISASLSNSTSSSSPSSTSSSASTATSATTASTATTNSINASATHTSNSTSSPPASSQSSISESISDTSQRSRSRSSTNNKSIKDDGNQGYNNKAYRDVKEMNKDNKDYKKLYEELLAENEKLRQKIMELEDQDKKRENEFNREKRQMQRKISELEEELKGLEQLKNDNQRLKDENGALIRVISKLSK